MITGGGSGLGLAMATALAAHGARVMLVGRTPARLDSAVAEITQAGGDASACVADVRDYAAVQAAVAATQARFGGLDIMIANAAGNFVVPVAEMSPNAWKAVVDIDLNGTFHCAKAAYPALRQSRFGGRFIAISTTRALDGWAGCAHAAAAKAGVMSLIRSLCLEWGGDGIRCNTICPGPIAGTEGVKRLYEQQGNAAAELAGVPLRRFGAIADVAQAALFLCSPAGDFITGADLVVDGGRARS